MATRLLTWNPKKTDWENLEECLTTARGDWSCGVSRSISKDDRVFVMRLGLPPRGIVASGRVTSKYAEGRHWDPVKRKEGRKALYVGVRLDTLLDPHETPLVGEEMLRRPAFRRMHWYSQSSGIRIPDEIARKLEVAWQRMTGSRGGTPPPSLKLQAYENQMTEYTGYRRSRDRGLRAIALGRAEGVCKGCNTNFRSILNGMGERILQVHHTKQLSASDKPRLTDADELAVLCPNCHAVVHVTRGKPMSIAKLRRVMAAASH